MADLTLDILKNIQNDLTNNTRELHALRSDMNMQFAAITERLSGQLISELEFRQELNELRERVQRLEKASNLTTS